MEERYNYVFEQYDGDEFIFDLKEDEKIYDLSQCAHILNKYEAKLAEKDEEIKQLKLDLGMFKSTNEFINRYGIEKAREVLLQSEKTRNQTAIAELEKVKDYVAPRLQFDEDLQIWFEEHINNQINLLKGETKC